MVRYAFCLGLIALVPFPLAASAAEVKPQSSIESVLVYAQGANVTRHVPITLPAGASTLVIEDLPGEIETDSLKVDGAADQAIEISSVETKLAAADPLKDPKRKAIADAVRSLEDKVDAIGDKMQALQGRQKFIDKLIEALPVNLTKGPGAADGADRWATVSAAIGKDLAEVAVAMRALSIEERGIREEIEKVQKALAELPPATDHMMVRVELSTAVPATGALTIAYRVRSAGWAPTYDALLTTGEAGGKPAITIVRRAEVTQATGEDWSNVQLTLSTARPSGGTAAPVLESSLVTIQDEEYDAVGRSRDQKTTAEPPRAALPDSFASEAEAGAYDQAVQVVQATADFGDFRAEYRLPGPVSVATGAGARSVRISSDVTEAELEVRAVPAVSPSAYLHGRFTAPAGAPILAGRVSLFRDGAFVGGTEVAFTNAGARLDLGFGADDRVKVTRTTLEKEAGESGILTSTHTETRSYRITVENLHKQPMAITVFDRMPYSENEQIVVAKASDATEPTAVNVDDRRGVLAWTYDYAPGESRDIKNAYQVSWPASESVVMLD